MLQEIARLQVKNRKIKEDLVVTEFECLPKRRSDLKDFVK